MPKIYCVHPKDENLDFLNKTINDLKGSCASKVETLNILNDYSSHVECLCKVGTIGSNDLICFLCHGRSDGLLGCSYRSEEIGNNTVLEDPMVPDEDPPYDHLKQHDKLLIDQSNIGILKGKKVFCLACNSNDIAKMAIANGCRVFFGFDEIKINVHDDPAVTNKVKVELRKFIFIAIKVAIDNGWSFHKLKQYLKLVIYKTNIKLKNINTTSKKHRQNLEVFKVLDEIASGMKVWGDGNIKVFDG